MHLDIKKHADESRFFYALLCIDDSCTIQRFIPDKSKVYMD